MLYTVNNVMQWEHEMKRKQNELPKQRNPFVEHMRFKVAGAHGQTKKAKRRDDKAALKKDIYAPVA